MVNDNNNNNNNTSSISLPDRLDGDTNGLFHHDIDDERIDRNDKGALDDSWNFSVATAPTTTAATDLLPSQPPQGGGGGEARATMTTQITNKSSLPPPPPSSSYIDEDLIMGYISSSHSDSADNHSSIGSHTTATTAATTANAAASAATTADDVTSVASTDGDDDDGKVMSTAVNIVTPPDSTTAMAKKEEQTMEHDSSDVSYTSFVDYLEQYTSSVSPSSSPKTPSYLNTKQQQHRRRRKNDPQNPMDSGRSQNEENQSSGDSRQETVEYTVEEFNETLRMTALTGTTPAKIETLQTSTDRTLNDCDNDGGPTPTNRENAEDHDDMYNYSQSQSSEGGGDDVDDNDDGSCDLSHGEELSRLWKERLGNSPRLVRSKQQEIKRMDESNVVPCKGKTTISDLDDEKEDLARQNVLLEDTSTGLLFVFDRMLDMLEMTKPKRTTRSISGRKCQGDVHRCAPPDKSTTSTRDNRYVVEEESIETEDSYYHESLCCDAETEDELERGLDPLEGRQLPQLDKPSGSDDEMYVDDGTERCVEDTCLLPCILSCTEEDLDDGKNIKKKKRTSRHTTVTTSIDHKSKCRRPERRKFSSNRRQKLRSDTAGSKEDLDQTWRSLSAIDEEGDDSNDDDESPDPGRERFYSEDSPLFGGLDFEPPSDENDVELFATSGHNDTVDVDCGSTSMSYSITLV